MFSVYVGHRQPSRVLDKPQQRGEAEIMYKKGVGTPTACRRGHYPHVQHRIGPRRVESETCDRNTRSSATFAHDLLTAQPRRYCSESSLGAHAGERDTILESRPARANGGPVKSTRSPANFRYGWTQPRAPACVWRPRRHRSLGTRRGCQGVSEAGRPCGKIAGKERKKPARGTL